MKIVIDGREDKLKMFLKSQRLWMKKHGVKVLKNENIITESKENKEPKKRGPKPKIDK